MKQWYDPEHFATLGRRSDTDGIPFTRTTMLFEAYWFVLKRLYFVLHNPPRMDFVIHFIDTLLMPKIDNNYQLLVSGAKKPICWKAFGSEWRAMSKKPCNDVYTTDNLSWKCSCAVFLTSRFLMCKHLISG